MTSRSTFDFNLPFILPATLQLDADSLRQDRSFTAKRSSSALRTLRQDHVEFLGVFLVTFLLKLA